jgi:acetylornithine/succinyldiaminopimelate/putrescine aminotransferase
MLDITVANTACDIARDTGDLRNAPAAQNSRLQGSESDQQSKCPLNSPLEEIILRLTSQAIPNLLRLHLSPHVAQACYLLDRLAALWRETPGEQQSLAAGQVFLANSGEEALSGALKLTRTIVSRDGDGRGALIYDPLGSFRHFSDTYVDNGERIEFLPAVTRFEDLERFVDEVVRQDQTRRTHPDEATSVVMASAHSGWLRSAIWRRSPERRLGTLVAPIATLPRLLLRLRTLHSDAPFVLNRWRWVLVAGRSDVERSSGNDAASTWPTADIVVFDESFVDRDVPFGAFAASHSMFRVWSGRGKATFHSTTYQPNAISNMRLVESLRQGCPSFFGSHSAVLERLERDADFRYTLLRSVYSRSLAQLANALGLRHGEITAAGHYYTTRGRRVFDGVAGVACSVRGHNPPHFVDECRELGADDACREELRTRLEALTGLPRWIPAVSGASAVEHALRIGLTTQSPRDWVLALRGGFGGKTLFALTGTWKSSLKSGLEPLYPRVIYVDPFAPDAITAIHRAFDDHPIGVAQFELVQGVGGVRETPTSVIRALEAMREKHGCLLSVDEVQTGMYRTGPFLRSAAIGLKPDLLTLGKGASDMIFPFALTLVSEAVERRLAERGNSIIADLGARCDYAMGIRSVLGTLRRAEISNLERFVKRQSARLAERLQQELRGKSGVREVRCYGLLVGIELETQGLARRLLARRVPQMYLLELLRENRFPMLVGFCQYEPHVLKLTPPLSITDTEVDEASRTLADVLTRGLPQIIHGLVFKTLSLRHPSKLKI